MQIWPFLRWHCISQTSFPGEVAKTIHNSCQISLMCWVDPTLSYGCLSEAKSLYMHIDHLLLVYFSWLLISIKIESLRSLDNVCSLSTISITIFLCTFSHESQIALQSQEIVSHFNADSGSSVGLGFSVFIGHKIHLCEKQIFFSKVGKLDTSTSMSHKVHIYPGWSFAVAFTWFLEFEVHCNFVIMEYSLISLHLYILFPLLSSTEKHGNNLLSRRASDKTLPGLQPFLFLSGRLGQSFFPLPIISIIEMCIVW